MPSLSAITPDPATDLADLPELVLLGRLATPLWLVRAEDGAVLWLNGAARALRDPAAAGGILRILPVEPVPAEPVPADPVERDVTIRGDQGSPLALTVRSGPAPWDGVLLVEARTSEPAGLDRRTSDHVHHLSHELRTPLTAVIGFAELLRDRLLGPPDSPRYGEAAAQIVAAGDYMLELINNLLDLARIEAGRLDLHEEDCPPALIVDATLSMMAARAGQIGVTLSARLAEDLPALRADPSLVRQMLTNLVGNALKFTARGGHVTVSAERDGKGDGGGGLVLAVADDGRGMPPDLIPQALTAFAQLHDPAHDPMTVAEHGSGLGLPLTAALIDLHGGGIAIDSAPGCGTTVRLRFPPERVVG